MDKQDRKQSHFIQIPTSVYEHLIDNLKIHADTDTWAKTCLEKLQAEAKPIIKDRTTTGTWLLDSESTKTSYKLS